MASFYDNWTHVGGLRMYSVESPPPPGAAGRPVVVLVHGLGLSHAYMMPVARALAGRYAVHAPNLPGFGQSDKPRAFYTVEQLADALHEWLRAREAGPLALLGNSFGCQIIGSLLARHDLPEAVAILQGPTAPTEERNWIGQFIRWRQNNRHNSPQMHPIAREGYRQCGYPRLLATTRHGLRHALEDDAPKIDNPALVVRGSIDPICRAAWARRLVSLLPRGRYEEIPGVAHTLVFSDPQPLAQVAAAFIDEAEGSAGPGSSGTLARPGRLA